jgi:SAM-dependent methyltransferase
MATDDRETLRTTFDSVAELYESARPDYPEELFDILVERTGFSASARLLEVGSATGKATLPLARRGFTITCIEIGSKLAAVARRNLADFPAVEVIEGAFETCAVLVPHSYDLVYAATAWHWIDPGTRYARAAELLRPGGHLAWWSAAHVLPVGGDPFFADIQEIYDEIGEGLPEGAERSRPDRLSDERNEVERSGLFRLVLTREFDWEISYDADGYLRLLDTFSGHIAMQAWQRDRLYGEIRRRLALRPDGRLRRHWGAVLHIARLVDA